MPRQQEQENIKSGKTGENATPPKSVVLRRETSHTLYNFWHRTKP